MSTSACAVCRYGILLPRSTLYSQRLPMHRLMATTTANRRVERSNVQNERMRGQSPRNNGGEHDFIIGKDVRDELKYDHHGRIVLYRGPPAMKTWLYYLVGCTFVAVGAEAAYNIYNHFSLPLFGGRDPEKKPELVEKKKRVIAACAVGAIGIGTGAIFLMVPSASVTRLVLDLPNRKLIIRTAVRPFSALPPRAIYPTALRRTAERHGYYLTSLNNERVVPLAFAFRVRGSALGSISHPTITLKSSPSPAFSRTLKESAERQEDERKSAAAKQHQELMKHAAKRSIEIRVGNDRLWYTIEASGGTAPTKSTVRGAYARWFAKLSYWMRGTTDWSEVSHPPTLPKGGERMPELDVKEPWFLSRETFDDVVPLVRRK